MANFVYQGQGSNQNEKSEQNVIDEKVFKAIEIVLRDICVLEYR
eukprot:CAMPEP_0116885574 /NCGR_PEP_ID=MMETSP0463-20121206/19019_1 /TAXON_ID=181622 /ORGANISM="Strombidinopsis sp, Strain SopsisLIS2011" /LENGTH=43 /DNA_ID= /DNA_START= /DNA_END= /DNA_ORIENTATION=